MHVLPLAWRASSSTTAPLVAWLPLQSWSSLADKVKAVLRDFPELKLTEGRKVLEIRPSIMWDKGRAVEFLLKSLGKYVLYMLLAAATCMLPPSLSSFSSLRARLE